MSLGFSFKPADVVVLLAAGWALYFLTRRFSTTTQAPALRGPPRKNIIYGYMKEYVTAYDDGWKMYAKWIKDYGPMVSVPWIIGTRLVVIADPKAIAHFYARETWVYKHRAMTRNTISIFFGKGIFWVEQDQHKLQRKALSPAFTNAALRNMTSVFFDSAYKAKSAWDSLIDASVDEQSIIDVQKWMNNISLDSVGIAGFSHDFKSLSGHKSSVLIAFDSLGTAKPLITPLLLLIGPILPALLTFTTKRNKIIKNMRETVSKVSDDLLIKTRKAHSSSTGDLMTDRSVLGQLLKAENTDVEMHMNKEEIEAQVRVTSRHILNSDNHYQINSLIVAGYFTTSMSLTWALIELGKHIKCQDKLREELSQLNGDPTYEQLVSGLPYLDGVVHEILRLHPPVQETMRMAYDDDILPLSQPILTKSGETVSSIVITKGTDITVPIQCINRSEYFWGPTAEEFIPDRWVDDLGKAKEIQGHKHLLSFSDGPRTCLGKGFALAEFKSVLATMIRHFKFEFPDGEGTEIGTTKGMVIRPKVMGEEGAAVPMVVRRVE